MKVVALSLSGKPRSGCKDLVRPTGRRCLGVKRATRLGVGSPPMAHPKMGVLFCHAAGFCAEVWRPVIDELSALARQPRGAAELVMSAIDLPGTALGLGRVRGPP